jgi:hypothetical protein
MGEPKEVERVWPATLGPHGARPSEASQACLGGMHRQAVSSETLWKNLHHTMCILFLGESNDDVVGVPDQERAPPQPRLDFLDEPLVQHVVQVNICQKR